MMTTRFKTLVKREFWEYRNSFLVVPLALSGILISLILISIILAGRLSVLDDKNFEIIIGDDEIFIRDTRNKKQATPPMENNIEGNLNTMEDNIKKYEQTINAISKGIENDDDIHIQIFAGLDEDIKHNDIARITIKDDKIGEDKKWNFEDEWTLDGGNIFNDKLHRIEKTASLNAILHGVNILFFSVLFLVSISYGLNTLFQDRKDRSILFWRTMPVSEIETILAKLSMVLAFAPVLTFVVSLITQGIIVIFAMALIATLNAESLNIMENLDLLQLWLNQLISLLVSSLWCAPLFAAILCASSFAKRSPLQTFMIPLIVIGFIEFWISGCYYVFTGVWERVPPMFSGYVDPHQLSTNNSLLNLGDMIGSYKMWIGLLVAAGFIALAVHFRKTRCEI